MTNIRFAADLWNLAKFRFSHCQKSYCPFAIFLYKWSGRNQKQIKHNCRNNSWLCVPFIILFRPSCEFERKPCMASNSKLMYKCANPCKKLKFPSERFRGGQRRRRENKVERYKKEYLEREKILYKGKKENIAWKIRFERI